MIAPSRTPRPASSPLAELGRVVGRSLGAARSVVKTQVLRADRATDAHHEARLDTCRNCPGGHARFKRDGSLHTCGPMLVSLTREGQPTCGCVLTRKARDVKQACPFGYWEQADEDAARVANRPDVVLGRVASDVGESLNDRVRATLGWDRIRTTRRGVLAGGVGGALAALVGLPVRAQSGGEQDCYVSISACPNSDGEKTHVRCKAVDGKKADAYIRDGRDCYQLDGASLYRGSVPSDKVVTSAGDVVDCNDDKCVEESSCANDDPEVDVTITWADSSSVSGINDPDGVPNSDDEYVEWFSQQFFNGQTIALCPGGYQCRSFNPFPITGSWEPNPIHTNTWVKNSFAQNRNQRLRLNAGRHVSYRPPSAGGANHYWNSGLIWVQFDGTYYAYSAAVSAKHDTGRVDTVVIPAGALNAGGLAGQVISDSHFQSVSTNGMNISWSKGAGNWGCS